MKQREFEILTLDELTLFAQGWSPDDAPTGVVCLVHGLGEHSGRYRHVGEALTAAGYALLAFDLRGHGRSQGLRGHTPSWDTLLDDLGRVLDFSTKRFSARPCFLYGHSLGGTLALNYPLQRGADVSGVIATGPLLRTAFAPPGWKLMLGRLLRGVLPAFRMSNEVDPNGLSRDSQVARDYVSDPLVHDRVSARLGVDMLEAGEWALAHAGEFSVPLLLMHGGADPLCSADASREFAARVSGDCTLKVWDGLYHEIHNEPERQQVFQTMIEWLRTHTPM